ncbi:MAG: hypothetical protein U0M42_06080 [Acutalibacteraceae bacterium]|nr:hypothetical protein [Acutalibacteraceae bacterium]
MKKLCALILTVCLLATMSVTAFAANTTGGKTEVSFNVDHTYTVTIPATVELAKETAGDGTVTYENDYTIEAVAGVRLKKNESIEVTVASDFIMTTTEGATLAYSITAGGNAVATGGVVATFGTDKAAQSTTIHIAANDPDYAGEYKDNVTFTIAVKDAPITFKCWGEPFTAEAGMTWGEWVNSPYNDGNNAYDWVFDTDGEHIYAVPTYYVLDDNGEVSLADVIVADYEYWSYA